MMIPLVLLVHNCLLLARWDIKPYVGLADQSPIFFVLTNTIAPQTKDGNITVCHL